MTKGKNEQQPQQRMFAKQEKGLFSTYFGQDDAPGIKVGPTGVVVFSLLFIFTVILLHFYDKYTR